MIKLITNATIESIINCSPDGLEKNYLVTDDKNKTNRIIHIANQLNKSLDKPVVIEAKYKYGFRSTRIEIAFFDNALFLLKIVSDFTKTDKEAIKLDSIISKIKSDYSNIMIVGCIVLDCEYDNDVVNNIKNILKNKFIFINAKTIEDRGVDALRD